MKASTLKATQSNFNVDKIVDKISNIKTLGKAKPLIVSSDNYIIDGHHRWFSKKTLVESNTNGYDIDTNNDIFSENIKVIIIDYPIKKLIQKLQEYKIKYNEKYLSKSLINLEKVKESESEIKKLKLKLKNIEDNYNKLNSLKVV